jgi:hypothetical protein
MAYIWDGFNMSVLAQALFASYGAAAPAGPFDYAAFLSGKTGDAWLADGTHYTDTGRTTVANVNDTLASITGEGTQFNANQSTAGARPTLRETSSKKYFEYDGGDTSIAGAVSNWNYLHNSAGNAYACFAISIGNSSDPNVIYGLFGTQNITSGGTGLSVSWDDRSSVSRNESIKVIVANNTGGSPVGLDVNAANGTTPPQTDCIIEYIKTGSSIEVFRNGVSILSGTITSPTAVNSTQPLHLGSSGGGFPMVGRIYSMIVCDTQPSSGDRTLIQEDMSARCVTPPL